MLLQKIDEDLKSAQREKNEVVLSALRNVKAAITNVEIEKKHPLTDDEILSVIAKKVKQHKDSIESFKAGDRPDLIDHEVAQMSVLQKFLPEGLSDEALTKIVKEVISTSKASAADFGKVMKEVMAKVKGQADGATITKIVKENLK